MNKMKQQQQQKNIENLELEQNDQDIRVLKQNNLKNQNYMLSTEQQHLKSHFEDFEKQSAQLHFGKESGEQLDYDIIKGQSESMKVRGYKSGNRMSNINDMEYSQSDDEENNLSHQVNGSIQKSHNHQDLNALYDVSKASGFRKPPLPQNLLENGRPMTSQNQNIGANQLKQRPTTAVNQRHGQQQLLQRDNPSASPPSKGGFLPTKVTLTEDQKPFSRQFKNYTNLIEVVMTPRPEHSYTKSDLISQQQNYQVDPLMESLQNSQTDMNQVAPYSGNKSAIMGRGILYELSMVMGQKELQKHIVGPTVDIGNQNRLKQNQENQSDNIRQNPNNHIGGLIVSGQQIQKLNKSQKDHGKPLKGKNSSSSKISRVHPNGHQNKAQNSQPRRLDEIFTKSSTQTDIDETIKFKHSKNNSNNPLKMNQSQTSSFNQQPPSGSIVNQIFFARQLSSDRVTEDEAENLRDILGGNGKMKIVGYSNPQTVKKKKKKKKFPQNGSSGHNEFL
eukprot:403351966